MLEFLSVWDSSVNLCSIIELRGIDTKSKIKKRDLTLQKNFKIIVCIFVITAFIPISLTADKVILLNGDTVIGRIISQNRKKVLIKTEFADVAIDKTKIKSITYTGPVKTREIVNVFLNNGQVVRGYILFQGPAKIIVQNDLGKLTIKKKDIEKMDWKQFITRARPVDGAFQYAWRSFLLPSWGQFYQGKKLKGWIIAGVFGSFALTTLYSYLNYQDAKDQHILINTQTTYDIAESKRKTYNTLLILTVSTWILNIVDSIVFAPKDGIKKNVPLKFGYNRADGTYSVFFQKKF